MRAENEIVVWDVLVRVFHWSLVSLFIIAYATEDWMDIHTLAGYGVLGLVAVRLVWGVIGTRYARFSDFVRSPANVRAYIKDLLKGRARRYLGHNPAGGAMIILLLLGLLLTGLSGIATLGAEEGAGPLAAWAAGLSHYQSEWLEEVHEALANLTVLLVLVHVAGVLVSSLLHGENLVRAMLTGRKPAQLPGQHE